MPKISHDEFCKSFLIMMLIISSKCYYEFLTRNELNFHPSTKKLVCQHRN
jgi:hypothetical protein